MCWLWWMAGLRFVPISEPHTDLAIAVEVQALSTDDSQPDKDVDLPDELGKVCDWRIDRLMAAGYPAWIAVQLALNRGVDLRQAESLLSDGCSVDLAYQILA